MKGWERGMEWVQNVWTHESQLKPPDAAKLGCHHGREADTAKEKKQS